MIRLLQDIWVLTETGIACWNKNKDNYIKDQLFGMLMCALDALAKKITKIELRSFEVGGKRFYFVKKSSLIFVGISSIDVDEDCACKELEFVKDKFLENYPIELFKSWNNDINIFSDFSQCIL